MKKVTSLLFEATEFRYRLAQSNGTLKHSSKHFLRTGEKWWPILMSINVMVIKFLYCLLMNDHKVDEPHIFCVKRKNLTELVQGSLRLWRIFAFIYSVCEKAFFCSHVNEFVWRTGCVKEEGSAHSFPERSSFSTVPMGSICNNMSGTSKSERSSPVFLYILSAAINETKSLISISCLKRVSPRKGIQSPTKGVQRLCEPTDSSLAASKWIP